jgi:hypothetical protein
VFVHTLQAPTYEEAQKLRKFGVNVSAALRRIFTATLSPDQVAELSHQSGVKAIKLSQRLKVLPAGRNR